MEYIYMSKLTSLDSLFLIQIKFTKYPFYDYLYLLLLIHIKVEKTFKIISLYF